LIKFIPCARHQWLTPVILATQEAEIRRIELQSQLGQIVCETLCQKKKPLLKRAGGVVQGASPEFKPQYSKKKKKSSSVLFVLNPSFSPAFLNNFYWVSLCCFHTYIGNFNHIHPPTPVSPPISPPFTFISFFLRS
jgi:hypothetical protein